MDDQSFRLGDHGRYSAWETIMKFLTVSLIATACLFGTFASINAQVDDTRHAALNKEISLLKEQLAEEKRQRIAAQLELLRFLNRDLLGRSTDSTQFQLAKTVSLKLAAELPRDTEVWRALAHTKALDGLTLAQATKLLGPPTDDDIPFGGLGGGGSENSNQKPTAYIWYYNPSGRHVADGLRAKFKDGKLTDWAVISM